MKRIFTVLFLCIICFAQTTFANVSDNLYKYTLCNGQTVVIKEIKNNPIVIIDTFIKTGSVNENDNNNGVAHFLEHLFFKGTTNHKRGEFERILESRGGVFNAATSRDYTHYYIKIPSRYFDEALSLHADMLLNIAIPQNELDMERKVVMEEITRSNDNPENIVFDNFMDIVFNGTSYQRKILGTNKIISTISRDEIMDFHKTWYKPQNMVTVIAGDVNAKDILPKVSRNFCMPCTGEVQAQRPVEIKAPKPLNIQNNTIMTKANVNSGYMILGYPTTGINNLKEAYALSIAASIFANGQNSILYKTLKEDENIILDAGAGNYELKDKGVFYVGVDFIPQNYDKVLQKVKSELNNFKNKPIDNTTLQLLKNSTKREYEYANESVTGISNMIGYNVAVGNGLKDYCDYISVIEGITPEFINMTMQKYFKDENLALSVLLPKKQIKISAKNNIVNVSDKTMKQAKLISQYKGVKKYKLSNGATLLLQKNTNNNVIATKIFLKGGSLAEEKAGTAMILSDTITKGTLNKNAKELADALDNVGTNINISNTYEYFEISMKTTKNDINEAFPLLKEIIEKPAFKDKDVKNSKEDALNIIKAAKDKPQNIAFENFHEGFYDNSPFLKTNKILEKSIPEINTDDVKKLHSRIFTANNMIISVAGNFDENDLISKFSSINNSKNFTPFNNNILKAKLSEPNENIIKKESSNSKGAWIVKGWQTKGFSTNDFAVLKLISTYLGGGFTSKLFVNLRENKGLAYETGAASSSKFNSGMFFMYIGTNPENIETVKTDFENEINNLKTKPITEKELSDLKTMMTGRLKIATETNMAKAELNGYYEFFDKGYKFGYDYPDLIEKITVRDIMDVSNKYFSQPYIMSIVAEDKYLK